MRLMVMSVRFLTEKWGIPINRREMKVSRYKMYKSGKLWLFAGVTLLAVNIQLVSVHADEAVVQSKTEQVTAEVAHTNSNVEQPALAVMNPQAAKDDNADMRVSEVADVEGGTADNTAVVENTAVNDEADVSAPTDVVASTDSSAENAANSESDTDIVDKADVNRTDNISDAASGDLDENSAAVSEQVENVLTPEIDSPVNHHPEVVAETEQVRTDADVNDMATEQQEALTIADAGRADNPTTTGNFGVDWEFDVATGTLTLHGGTLKNSYGDNPWKRQTWASSIKKIFIADRIIAGTNMNGLFSELTTVESYEGLEKIDTSAVTNMQSVFKGNYAVKWLDLTAWDVSKVTTMANMFMGSFMGTELNYLNLSGWQTHNVTDMQNMFWHNKQLRLIDGLTDWDTSQVVTMTNMFAHSGVQHLDLSNFDSSSLVEMDGAFGQMANLESIEFGSKFTTEHVTDMNGLFADDEKLKSLDLSYFNMKNVEANWQMLAGLTSLQTLVLGPGLDFSRHGNQPLVDLPDVPKNNTYTGKWVNIDDPSQTLTSTELLALYAGKSAPKATFVWETKSAASITAKDSEIFVNQSWDWSQNVTQLIDANGQTVDVSTLLSTNPQAVSVSGDTVDTSKPGTYQVTLTYAGHQTTVTVTVKENQSQLNLQASDVTVEIDSSTGTAVWQPQDNFTNATDSDGQSVDWSGITVIGTPDLTTAGSYEVVYQFTDMTGQLVSATVTVTVVENEADTGDGDGEEPGEPEVPGEPEEPEVPGEPEEPEVPGEPEEPEVPGEPEEPEVPEVPGEPEQPGEPEHPEAPERPEVPERPEMPEHPEVPERPEAPTQPSQPSGPTADTDAGHQESIRQRPNVTGPSLATTSGLNRDASQKISSEQVDQQREKSALVRSDQETAVVTPLQERVTTDAIRTTASESLPQTGEQSNHLGLMGLMILMATGLASVLGIKRRRG
ncbi:BspA family leucine-rich repeat surface protein [Lactiplantibacillus pentosus]|uniref:BspA family leucine-rich repeat surface protein n=1 Tax=Lactiplantibacillus pentosus TaxID=1589 RepID=UPI0021A45450|nr:BspA family leucine-rich repeat surface protein [Lactiplantibacillus pentosus]MCT3064017.1 BspA family leucine-rich repeat surface protein [Lactiplantibacillus pentosus]